MEFFYAIDMTEKQKSEMALGEPSKKTYILSGHVLAFNFILLSLKNEIYLTKDILSTYGHITLKFVGRLFAGLLHLMYAKKYSSFSPKNWGEEKFFQNLFR